MLWMKWGLFIGIMYCLSYGLLKFTKLIDTINEDKIEKYKELFRKLLNYIWIILIIGLVIFAIYIYNDKLFNNMMFYFLSTGGYGKDGSHFQWVGLSVFFAAVGLFINALDNKRKIRLEVLSKNKVEWLKEVRNIFSNYFLKSQEIDRLENENYGDVILETENTDYDDIQKVKYGQKKREKIGQLEVERRNIFLLLMSFIKPIDDIDGSDKNMWNLLVDYEETVSSDCLDEYYVGTNYHPTKPNMYKLAAKEREYTKEIWEEVKDI